MTDLYIEAKQLQGSVIIPPSKSLAHRAVIAAALAQGESIIDNIQLSDDIKATIESMTSLGAKIELLTTADKYLSLRIQGIPQGKKVDQVVIDANESGSTLRFLIPIASVFSERSQFIGRGKLGQRPLDTYQEIYAKQALEFKQLPSELLDLHTAGRLQSGYYELAGNVSSQFITGLLYTLPLLEEDSVIQITTPIESIGYIDLTLDVLKEFGIELTFDRTERRFMIPGKQVYQARSYRVEADYSQAAFFLVAAALGNPLEIHGLRLDSQQGDRAILDFLKDYGVEIQVRGDNNVVSLSTDRLQANLTIDGTQVPDIIPITSLLACLAEGESQLINLERLKIKESDRLSATQSELAKLGASIQAKENQLTIVGQKDLAGNAEVWSHKDHRIAMMLAIASTVCKEGIILRDAECVAKSYPDFWEVFEELGGVFYERNLG